MNILEAVDTNVYKNQITVLSTSHQALVGRVGGHATTIVNDHAIKKIDAGFLSIGCYVMDGSSGLSLRCCVRCCFVSHPFYSMTAEDESLVNIEPYMSIIPQSTP